MDFNIVVKGDLFSGLCPYGYVTTAGEGLQNLGMCSLYRATPAVTWGLGFSSLIRRPIGKTEAPCHSRCGTINIPPCSTALSAKHRPRQA
jgi:hypothetical protein